MSEKITTNLRNIKEIQKVVQRVHHYIKTNNQATANKLTFDILQSTKDSLEKIIPHIDAAPTPSYWEVSDFSTLVRELLNDLEEIEKKPSNIESYSLVYAFYTKFQFWEIIFETIKMKESLFLKEIDLQSKYADLSNEISPLSQKINEMTTIYNKFETTTAETNQKLRERYDETIAALGDSVFGDMATTYYNYAITEKEKANQYEKYFYWILFGITTFALITYFFPPNPKLNTDGLLH